MIKLSDDTKEILSYAIKYCALVDIKTLMVDKKGLRAKQDEKAVYLIEPGDFDFLEFDTFYTNRIQSLSPKIKMFEKSKIDYEIHADLKTLEDDTTVVSKLKLSGGRTKVNFNTSMVTEKGLPKRMKDPEYYSFTLNSEDLKVLKEGISAMGAKEFKLYTTEENGIDCEITDIEQDVLTQNIAESFNKLHEDSEDSFEVKYNFKILSPLLNEAAREKDKVKIKITRKGIMALKINGLSMYIFPESD